VSDVVVRLTPEEIAEAERVGLLRLRSSGNTGRTFDRSQVRDYPERVLHERLGNMAEMAVAHHLGIPWDGAINRFHTKPDVGRFDVRATTLPGGRLILRDNDHGDRPFVLVTGDGLDGVMILRGWLWGHEGKIHKWLRDPHSRRPCWMIPQSELHPVPTKLVGVS
jgi:hypothetical protein